jgi:hypothetical protein
MKEVMLLLTPAPNLLEPGDTFTSHGGRRYRVIKRGNELYPLEGGRDMWEYEVEQLTDPEQVEK